MKVMKFGGGCLRAPALFGQVADIVVSETDSVVIVVSAIYGVTDQLIRGIENARKSEKTIPRFIAGIRQIHRDFVNKSIRGAGIRHKVSSELNSKIDRLQKLLFGVAYTEEITHSVRAHISGYGERLAALILSGVLQDAGQASIDLSADEVGIVSDDDGDKATVLLGCTKKNCRSHLLPVIRKGIIPVITGFFGVTAQGKIASLGRNGSDYSAAVLAYAIGADVVEIWKDVDGFMSADPKMVADAQPIGELSYREAAELSYFGARILHPRSIEPLRKSGIKLIIKNLLKPNLKGTVIFGNGYETEDVIKSVTCNKQIGVIKIRGSGVGYKPGVMAKIGHALSRTGINIYSIITSQTCINLLVERTEASQAIRTLRKIEEGVIEKVEVDENSALIAVVGEGLLKIKGIAARVFTAVSAAKVNIEMISTGASEVASYFIVKECDVERTVKAIHGEFSPPR